MSDKDEELKNLCRELIDAGFGIAGHPNSDDADYYKCTACYASTPTTGYASSIGAFDDVQHKPDCKLARLRELVYS